MKGDGMMLSVQEAARAARAYAQQLYDERELKDLRVEEVELAEEDATWYVTLGWIESAVKQVAGFTGTFEGNQLAALPRVYKIFTIDAETGHVSSMKIRD
jgi:hypothetical protein